MPNEKDMKRILGNINVLISNLVIEKRQQRRLALDESRPKQELVEINKRTDELSDMIRKLRERHEDLICKAFDTWEDSLGDIEGEMEEIVDRIDQADALMDGVIEDARTFTALIGNVAKILEVSAKILV